MVVQRLRPIMIGWTILFVLFLMTLAFQLLLMQHDIDPRGLGSLQPTASVLMKVLGSLLLILPLYGVFSRFIVSSQGGEAEDHSPEAPVVEQDRTGVMIEAFHDVVRRLREKEQELVRLRSEAEARAQEFESYNENILRSVASGVITFNEDSIVTTFNEAAGRILRIEWQSIIGKTCDEVFGVGSKISRLLTRAHRHGEIITREQFELEQRDGRRIWLGVSTSLLKDRAERFIGTTFVFTDLTEVKELQAQVELRERMTVVGEMSAGIAHEFRNFMGTILGAAKLIARQIKPNEVAQESLSTILHVISDMDYLITQFLNFSKKTELDLKPVDLHGWLKRVVDQVWSQSASDFHHAEIHCPANIAAVSMDEVLMRQALSNLVQNAVEAMPKGGSVQISTAMVQSHSGRPELELRITDSGLGIPGDRLDKIFLPFYTTKTKGTGLGLALVHKIVLLHNGRIQVESQEGKGTTFRVHLPIEVRV
ncbi:MAG TPA: ATP-binding protein [Nitrospirales bacterium]